MSDANKKSIRKAFDFAVEAHSNQRRKTGEPYIFHPIAVAKIVAYKIGLQDRQVKTYLSELSVGCKIDGSKKGYYRSINYKPRVEVHTPTLIDFISR